MGSYKVHGRKNVDACQAGFGHVSSENVFKVCDEPHPLLVKDMLMHCVSGDIAKAYKASNLLLLV
ncbi:Subunit of heteropentameric Replication factor C (RF-C) [Homalodisca vitripennis]|nr:Subunit of heteropentameric Replication factor C (RF-C) [Homalodisca vitripennis]